MKAKPAKPYDAFLDKLLERFGQYKVGEGTAKLDTREAAIFTLEAALELVHAMTHELTRPVASHSAMRWKLETLAVHLADAKASLKGWERSVALGEEYPTE